MKSGKGLKRKPGIWKGMFGRLIRARQERPVRVGFRRFLKEGDLPSGKSVVIVAPHPDDVSISLGATASMLVKRGNTVHIVTVTSGSAARVKGWSPKRVAAARRKEAEKEAGVLGAKLHFLGFNELAGRKDYGAGNEKKFVELLKRLRPDMLVAPHMLGGEFDHPDHLRAGEIVRQALPAILPGRADIELWNYETPWVPLPKVNTFVLPGSGAFRKKMAGIRAHKTQTKRAPFAKASKAMSRVRAVAAGELHAGFGERPAPHKRAEAFFVQRAIMEIGGLRLEAL